MPLRVYRLEPWQEQSRKKGLRSARFEAGQDKQAEREALKLMTEDVSK